MSPESIVTETAYGFRIATLRAAFEMTIALGLALGLATSASAQSTVPGTFGPVITTMPPPVYENAPRLPNAPKRLDTFPDKATRCVHYGTSQGVQPGQIGQYTRECVNSQ